MVDEAKNPELMRDIYHPDNYYLGYDPRSQKFKKKPARPRGRHWGFIYGGLCILFLIVGFYGFRLFVLKDLVADSSLRIYEQLAKAQIALANLNPEAAIVSFGDVKNELETLFDESSKFGVLNLSSAAGAFFSPAKDLPEVFRELIGVSQAAVDISEDVAFLKNEALGLVLAKRGPELIQRLKSFDEKIDVLRGYAQILESRDAQLGSITEHLPEIIETLDELSLVNDSIIRFLDSPTERDLLVLLQNSSEMRPAGGFIGSYAHARLDHASLVGLEVVDIYDPDGQLDTKIIPPTALQRVTKNWGARDSNWFFDFPTSAVQVMDLLNSSKIYQERGVLFDSVIAINDKVLSDVINLIEPIELEQYDLVLTADNFLEKVQAEVEAGEDKADGEPKRILKVLAPLVIDKLTHLSADQSLVFRDLVAYHIQNRDIMAYVNNPTLEQYLKKMGLGGEVIDLADDEDTDYLGVVNANIAGHKTDALIDQTIKLESLIDLDGRITNSLSVSRTHKGTKKMEWWYSATNKDYLRVLTPAGANVVSATGNEKWPKMPSYDYSGYEVDGDLKTLNSTLVFLPNFNLETFTESGKQAFAGWVYTEAGQTSQFNLEYQLPRSLDLSKEKTAFKFIFERQSGVTTSLEYKIEAPAGFYWAESGAKVFEYKDSDPAGRVSLELTLVRTTSLN